MKASFPCCLFSFAQNKLNKVMQLQETTFPLSIPAHIADEAESPWNHVLGLERLSLCDWPGHASSVLFCGGCNLRCPTCHNADLAWSPEEFPALSRSKVLTMLAERKRWLDGVVITGGEPTCVPGLEKLVRDIASLGLPIKLDSNGMRPEVIESLIEQNLVEQFFVDLKGPFRLYPALTGNKVSEERAARNMEHVFELARFRPKAFVFRMTRVPLLSEENIQEALLSLPEGFPLKMQQYKEPRRTHAPVNP